MTKITHNYILEFDGKTSHLGVSLMKLPLILFGTQRIAEAVGDWYFERGNAKYTDCAYPCDGTCHHIVFRGRHL
jgi:hypothetical protein